MAANTRYRNVCFTHNNPEGLIDFVPEKMSYLIYQEEVGDSGTYHFQGYCEFSQQLSLGQAKRLLGGDRCHIERRRGNQQQAIDYCKKEGAVGGPYEHGEPRQQGKRMDLEAFKEDIQAGKRKRDLVDDHFGVIARYPRFYDTLTQMNRPTRTVDLEVILLIGETGLGKTRHVYDAFAGGEELFITPLNNGTMWWDGYDGHKVVLMDDFAGAASHLTLGVLLRLLDRYPVMVPIKGGFTWWLPDKIFVTTNILPKLWYKWDNRGEQYKALARRFSSVVLFYVPLCDVDPGSVEQAETWWEENAPAEALYSVHPEN